MKYASVIVDISLQKLDKTFDYEVPAELDERIKVGVKVTVPFGSRQITGYVLKVREETAFEKEKIKSIISVVEGPLRIDPSLIELAIFMRDRYGCTLNQALKTVMPSKKTVAKKKTRVEHATVEEGEPTEHFALNSEQQAAVSGILSDLSKPALLHGITGSGKTQVYMALIDEMISRGKQVILLIPEISLTLQNIRIFHSRYADRVGVINSRLSAGEKYAVQSAAAKGELDLVIGPRSAVFVSFKNLGLIIVDEEHENAYFSETTPRYNTVEVAEMRALLAGAGLVLGSATPLLDDYKKALEGRYRLFLLKERAVENSKLPKVHIVDLREELKSGNRSIFSRELAAGILDRLEKKEQVMLFLNRRGFAGFVSCRSCGHVVKCPHCDVSLTSHAGGRLICHYCGYEQKAPTVCPKCGSKYIAAFGIGTQKIESLTKQLFPEARVLRMDADTTSGKAGHSRIIESFSKGKADILIGTQMIVKGHDFPNVTLVGVIAADLSLYSNDFRASERTFQLLTQAAGRAGRGDKEGLVIIQTYNPDNSTIRFAAAQDYEGFYADEIEYRKLLDYPPAGAMLSVLLTNPSEEEVYSETEYLIGMISKKYADSDLHLIGPSDTGIKKIQDKYRRMFFVKFPDRELLKSIQNDIIKEPITSSVQIDIL